ncbi:NUDIX domain-containing protein [Flavobacterium sp. MXW15]|uniref:NUDIX domain-containing protein n=1 Tax=Xanthomonas chitinilytica TaxID=2989819 RepID=A0ABT3JXQ9_9XANT|nr:NUDIX domain-containing protein [Xanthomonas sp. H13-6]MCW4455905.1 NUDIX domain-containing protein [Flavobacterium sp. MXW15]MCW4473280.1 NUDIX domain-containing protein [Xanthomonas sp. H13-6]
MPPAIRIVVAVILDAAGRVLVVRKHGSDTFIQPGGKREPGEDTLATLARELHEELGVAVVAGSARPLGRFQAEAVNEPGRQVQGEAFLVEIEGVPATQAEIAELAWIPLQPPHGVALAPLSAGHILPAARAVLAGAGQTARIGR